MSQRVLQAGVRRRHAGLPAVHRAEHLDVVRTEAEARRDRDKGEAFPVRHASAGGMRPYGPRAGAGVPPGNAPAPQCGRPYRPTAAGPPGMTGLGAGKPADGAVHSPASART